MSKYFSIPHDALIGQPPPTQVTPTGDYHFAHSRLRFWAQADQGSRQVVAMLFDPGDEIVYAVDGPWRQQLESCSGGCDGGSGPTPGGGGEVRVAYGGVFQPDPRNYSEVQFTTPGEWVVLDNSVVQMEGYDPDGTDEMTYDLAENSVTLDWLDPVPTSRQFAQVTVFWSVAAVGNDQTYEFGVIFNSNQITSPNGRVILDYERAGDVETLAQHGQGLVQNGDKLQLVVRNVNGTNPLRLYTVNMRITVSAQNDPIINTP